VKESREVKPTCWALSSLEKRGLNSVKGVKRPGPMNFVSNKTVICRDLVRGEKNETGYIRIGAVRSVRCSLSKREKVS